MAISREEVLGSLPGPRSTVSAVCAHWMTLRSLNCTGPVIKTGNPKLCIPATYADFRGGEAPVSRRSRRVKARSRPGFFMLLRHHSGIPGIASLSTSGNAKQIAQTTIEERLVSRKYRSTKNTLSDTATGTKAAIASNSTNRLERLIGPIPMVMSMNQNGIGPSTDAQSQPYQR